MLAGTDEAATTIRPAAAAGSTTYTPGRYYEYDEPPRRRAIWPWLLGALIVALALVGGWFAWQEVQSQLSAAKPVAVPDVVGSVERLAVQQIQDAGLKELVERTDNADVPVGQVFAQDPQPGDRTERGNFVTITVSTGPKKVVVPNVVGRGRDDAVSELTQAGLKPNPVGVNSLEPVDTVLATGPSAGTEVLEGTAVRVQLFEGPEADLGPERGRNAVRERGIDPAGSRLRRLAQRRGRCHTARGRRRRAEPGRGHAAGQGLGDHASRSRRDRRARRSRT